MTKLPDQVGVYTVREPNSGREVHYLSLAPKEVVLRSGLRPEAVLGQLHQGPDKIEAQFFATNPRFFEFLQSTIARHVLQSPSILEQAAQSKDGYIHVLDTRTPKPQAAVPSHDIFGAVQVRNAQPVNYQPNPNYRVFTPDGLLGLEPWLFDKLLTATERLFRNAS